MRSHGRPFLALTAGVLLCVLLTACTPAGDDEPEAASPEPAPDQTPSPPEPGPSPDPGDGEPGQEPGEGFEDAPVGLETVATLESPTAMTVRPGEDDTLYIGERPGRVRVIRDGEAVEEPLLDISDRTTVDAERGLLGLAFDADGEHLYVSHTDPAGTSRLVEYAMDQDSLEEGSAREVLSVQQPYGNHNGGHIELGPDGMLYLGLGDGGSAGDPHDHGQNTETLLGALLRIDPRRGDPYAIPADNPFAGDAPGADEIWAYGLRNPWRFAFDRDTGDLWIADVGQDEREEINFMPAGEGRGANYGWNRLEGTLPFEGEAPEDHVPPIYEYDNEGDRCAITGGRVYRGEEIPALVGAYLYGDFCSGEVRALQMSDGGVVAERDLGLRVPALVSFGENANGEVYVLSLEGDVSRVVP